MQEAPFSGISDAIRDDMSTSTSSLNKPNAQPGPLEAPWEWLIARVPGLLLAGSIAAVSIWAAQYAIVRNNGLSALTLAIVLGLIIGNTVYPKLADPCHTGVNYAKARLLRAGIVLYGLRLTFQDIGQVGMAGVLIDALVLCSTFVLAQWLGNKVLAWIIEPLH